MTYKLKYFCLENEQIIKLETDKMKDRVSIFVKDKQKVYYPDLIQYLKNTNEETMISSRLNTLLAKVKSLKEMSDLLSKEAKIDDELFFEKYCNKMKYNYTNASILLNKQTYTEEELFISSFIEQSGIKRYPSSKLDDYVDFCMYNYSGYLEASLFRYNMIITTLYNILKVLHDCFLNKTDKKLSLFEMKIIKFLCSFKSFFYLSSVRVKYSIQEDLINRSPRSMKKRVDTAIANASKMLDIYFLRNVKIDNLKYKSFFDDFKKLSFDDKIGNTNYLEEFDEHLENMCNEDVILPEMMKLHSFQYILPMYMSNDLVNMIRAYGFFMLNYRTPLVNDDYSKAKVNDIKGELERYYDSYLDGACFFYDNVESVFVTRKNNKNICYFDDGMLSLDYIECVVDACLDISQHNDILSGSHMYELDELFLRTGFYKNKDYLT